MVTSRRSLDAALVHDDLTTHEDTIFCLNFDRDGMPSAHAHPHVAQSLCPQVHCGVHTNTASFIFGLAQPSAWEDKKQVRNEGDIDSASSHATLRCTSTSRTQTNAIAAGSPPCSRLTASLLPASLPACCHCTTPCHACHPTPHHTAPCCAAAGPAAAPSHIVALPPDVPTIR